MNEVLRTPWQVMTASVSCLVIRDIQKKFISSQRTIRSMGFLWIFFQPMLHVALWVIIRAVMGIKGSGGLPMPIFILLGAIPFLLTLTIISQSTTRILAERGLYMFRQIKPVDVVIALVVSEFMIIMVTYVLMLAILWWFGIHWQLCRPLLFFEALFCFFLFLMGATMIFSVLGFFFVLVRRLIIVVTRMLYIFSGVFFPASLIPEAARPIFMANPLFQFIEISRESFSTVLPHVMFSDLTYLWKCGLTSLFLGLMAQVAFRQKIMVEIEQR